MVYFFCCVDVKDIDPAVLNYAATKLQAPVSRFFFSNSVARLQQWFISFAPVSKYRNIYYVPIYN
jgi:hypothetical protein